MSDTSSLQKDNSAYCAAINFALNQNTKGLVFLRFWKNKEWTKIRREFPDFDLKSTSGLNVLKKQGNTWSESGLAVSD